MAEPTVVLCRCREGELRVPIWPDRGSYESPRRRRFSDRDSMDRDGRRAGEPTQIEVDPDHALLDARPDNNRWKPEIAWRLTPLMSPLDMSSQFQAYDRSRSSPARSSTSTPAAASSSASSGSTAGR